MRVLKNPFILAGLAIAVTGGLLLLWFNIFVLTEAEIARLEAGGSGNATAFETFAMIGGPAMLVIGISVMACCPLWKGGTKANRLVESETEAV